jgi:hypothetical protein
LSLAAVLAFYGLSGVRMTLTNADAYELVVDDRGHGSLDHVHRQRHRCQRLGGERRVEQDVPQIASRALVVDELVSTRGRPPRKRAGPVVEVDELSNASCQRSARTWVRHR